jgi:prevent-host-death family protein
MGKVPSLSEARDNWAELIGRAPFGGERATIPRRGKPVAVVVPVAA